jgi:hypothetical protein
MRLIIPSLIALNTVTAVADISPIEARTKIEESYHPEISYNILESDWSLYGCKIQKIQISGKDPVTSETRDVNVSLYKPRKGSNGSVVMILPPTGGVNILDRGYANELCSLGITAAIVSSWRYQDETSLDFEMHNNGALRALAAARHVVEFLDSSEYKSIGVLGTSIGAVAGTLVLGFESRVTAAALIAGSANFTDIITTSDEKGAAQLRQARMKKFGYRNLEEYSQAVKKNVWVEPESFITSVEEIKSLVISADNDSTVLSEYQLELAELLQTDNHIHRSGNHLQVIKDSFCYNRNEITDFFVKALGGKNEITQ